VIEEKTLPIKTATFNDLIRLAISTALPPQATAYLLKFKHNGKIIIGILGVSETTINTMVYQYSTTTHLMKAIETFKKQTT